MGSNQLLIHHKQPDADIERIWEIKTMFRGCLGLLCSRFSSSAPRTPPWSSSTVEFVKQVLLHKKRGVGGVPLEVLQEKREVGLQLHVFLGAEFVELDVFDTVELERIWKNGSRAVLNTPLILTKN
jgi:hypothetical protein